MTGRIFEYLCLKIELIRKKNANFTRVEVKLAVFVLH